LVLPEGVDEVVCDQFVRQLPRHELCAVVFENRLLILPIAGHLLDPAYVQVTPHKSVWESLGIRRATPNFAPKNLDSEGFDFEGSDFESSESATGGVAPTLIDLTLLDITGPVAGRLVERFEGGDTVIDLTVETQVEGYSDFVDDEPAPVVLREYSVRLHGAENVVLARPLRTGQRLRAPAVELSEVTMPLESLPLHSLPLESTVDPLGGRQTVLRASLQIATGETVGVVGARKRAARMLMSLVVGLEEPKTGLVFHQGVPIGLPSLDGERWKSALPGVLPRRMPKGVELSVLDYVSYPMQLFGVVQHVSHNWARVALDELGAISLAEQPFDSLKGPDRRLVALARALVGPWPARFLFDPLYGFDDETAANARRAIRRYTEGAATLVMLTDDPELLRLADRVLGVSDGQVYEAVRRE
jgi:predicted ABC-type transport system involved in lysophospholipase L1 biosynthesis ATPase subunit